MAGNLPAVPTGLNTALRNFLGAVARVCGTTSVATKGLQNQVAALQVSLNSSQLLSTQLPSVPSNVIAAGAFTHVVISWDRFSSKDFSFAEIWRSTNNVLSNAVIVGTTNGNTFSDEVGYAANFYYWVRFISPTGSSGAYSSPGVNATTAVDITAVLNQLNETLKVNPSRFTVVHPSTNGENAPFLVDGNNVYMTTAMIKDASIQSAKIQSLAADKIDATSLTAISANIGTATAGILVGPTGQFKIDLANSVLEIKDDTGQVRVKAGKLS